MSKQTGFKKSVVGVAVGIACAQAAMAQEVKGEIQKVTVTGSNIKRISAETASHVQVVTAQEIKTTGASSVRELLDNLTASSYSLSDKAGGTSFAGGASGVALRNLGMSSTLVLLNGRRVANYALAESARTTFVNVDSLPLEIIERVEILKDGASAIYGSDAVAGVINIITRKQASGLVAKGAYNSSLRDSHINKEQTASLTGGLGDLAKDGYNVLANVELFHRSPYNDRDVMASVPQWFRDVNPSFGAKSTYSYPGNFTGKYPANYHDAALAGKTISQPAAGCPAEQVEAGLCRYDQWSRIGLSPQADRVNLFSSGRMTISEKLSGFAELQFSRTKTTYFNAPSIMQYTGAPGSTWYDARNRKIKSFTEPQLAAGNAFNPFDFPIALRYRFADDVGMFKKESEAEQYRVLTGLDGSLGEWEWNAAIGSMGSTAKTRQRGGKHAEQYLQAVNSGEYKFGGDNSAELLARMFPVNGADGKSSQTFVDAKASRELMDLPGGRLGLAVGVDLRHETFRQVSTENLLNAEVVGQGSADIRGSRNVGAAFAELSAPLTKQLEANFAMRADKSSGTEKSVVPKLGLRYEVNKSLLLRGTVAEGFRAPSLAESGSANVSAFSLGVEDPKRCADAVAMFNVLKTGNAVDLADGSRVREANCRAAIGKLNVSNPALAPERSKSLTLGFVLEPARNVTVALDYYRIERRDQIDTKSTSQVLGNEDLKPGSVERLALSADDAAMAARVKALSGKDVAFSSGVISNIKSQYVNLDKTRVSGFDLDVASRWNLGALGRLSAGVEATYQLEYRNWDANEGGFTENLVGSYENFRWKAVGKLMLESGKLVSGLRLRYHSGSRLADDKYDKTNSIGGCAGKGISADMCQLKPDYIVDLSLQYKATAQSTFALNVKNLFDRDALVDVRQIDPPIRGRSLKLTYEHKFF